MSALTPFHQCIPYAPTSAVEPLKSRLDWRGELRCLREHAAVRARSCCEGGVEVMRKLSLKVEGVLDRRRLDVRIQLVDLRLRKPAIGERAERLRLQARMDNVRGL